MRELAANQIEKVDLIISFAVITPVKLNTAIFSIFRSLYDCFYQKRRFYFLINYLDQIKIISS